jgi:hypothetical protein
MLRGLWPFIIAGELLGNAGMAAEFIASDSQDPSKHEPSSNGYDNLDESTETKGKIRSWHLVRSAAENTEPSTSAILHTADFERSDPQLAGLMLRCGRQGIETIIVVVDPFPPRARPQIALRTLGQESSFIGTIIPTGAGIRLPSDATSLMTGPWSTKRELEIKIIDGNTTINGVVALSGLPEAIESLKAECVQK